MKILRSGIAETVPAKTAEHPWIGAEIQCARCDCRFVLEGDDEYERVKCHRDDLGRAECYKLSCPGCGRYIQLESNDPELRAGSKTLRR